MLKKTIHKINFFSANLIYFICILIAIIINIFFYYQTSFQNIIEILGTFIQIALPCYVIVPILAKRDMQGAKQMLVFLFFILAITYTLKFTYPSKRPYGGSMSFPSGHTAGAFCGAVFLSFRYGKKYLMYTMPLAFFVAFSRVYTRNHWLIDVFASIFICFFLGIFIVKKHKKTANLVLLDGKK